MSDRDKLLLHIIENDWLVNETDQTGEVSGYGCISVFCSSCKEDKDIDYMCDIYKAWKPRAFLPDEIEQFKKKYPELFV